MIFDTLYSYINTFKIYGLTITPYLDHSLSIGFLTYDRKEAKVFVSNDIVEKFANLSEVRYTIGQCNCHLDGVPTTVDLIGNDASIELVDHDRNATIDSWSTDQVKAIMFESQSLVKR